MRLSPRSLHGDSDSPFFHKPTLTLGSARNFRSSVPLLTQLPDPRGPVAGAARSLYSSVAADAMTYKKLWALWFPFPLQWNLSTVRAPSRLTVHFTITLPWDLYTVRAPSGLTVHFTHGHSTFSWRPSFFHFLSFPSYLFSSLQLLHALLASNATSYRTIFIARNLNNQILARNFYRYSGSIAAALHRIGQFSSLISSTIRYSLETFTATLAALQQHYIVADNFLRSSLQLSDIHSKLLPLLWQHCSSITS